MPGTPINKVASTWFLCSKCLPDIIIITIIIIIIIIIITIVIATYVWVNGTREQVLQSNLSNNEGRRKKASKYLLLNRNISP